MLAKSVEESSSNNLACLETKTARKKRKDGQQHLAIVWSRTKRFSFREKAQLCWFVLRLAAGLAIACCRSRVGCLTYKLWENRFVVTRQAAGGIAEMEVPENAKRQINWGQWTLLSALLLITSLGRFGGALRRSRRTIRIRRRLVKCEKFLLRNLCV